MTFSGQSVRRFVEREIVPFHAKWEEDGIVPRELWLKAGAAGLLCCTVPEEYGGLGLDYLFDVVVFEELWRSGASGPGFLIHTDLVATYILSFGTEEQKRKWLPKMVSRRGDRLARHDRTARRQRPEGDPDRAPCATAMTSSSTARRSSFPTASSATSSCSRPRPTAMPAPRASRCSLSRATGPGFKRGRNLEKLGMKAQDTSELFFDNVRIPATNMLGEEGKGFALMMTKLSQERLAQAIRSATVTETVIDWTRRIHAERSAFGQKIADFQNTQFKLADLKTKATVARVFTDKCIALFMEGKLDPVDAAMAKMFTSELHCETVDECLQLFGGWGYMWEYPIARAYADARVVKIAGGSIEIMKTIIARQMFAQHGHCAAKKRLIAAELRSAVRRATRLNERHDSRSKPGR